MLRGRSMRSICFMRGGIISRNQGPLLKVPHRSQGRCEMVSKVAETNFREAIRICHLRVNMLDAFLRPTCAMPICACD